MPSSRSWASAGEDDLDIPDIVACRPAAGRELDSRQDRFPPPPRESGNGRLRGATKSNTAEVLDAGQSAALRDKLLAEVASLTSTVAAPRRYRNREHLRYVAQQACLVCGRKPSDPHHLRYPQPRALGRKASDEFAVPPCSSHHRAVHRAGDEQAWWQTAAIDPVKVARTLWRPTRVNEGRIRPEQTTRAVNSDILSSVAGKAPE
jgi:hypothetical protein